MLVLSKADGSVGEIIGIWGRAMLVIWRKVERDGGGCFNQGHPCTPFPWESRRRGLFPIVCTFWGGKTEMRYNIVSALSPWEKHDTLVWV